LISSRPDRDLLAAKNAEKRVAVDNRRVYELIDRDIFVWFVRNGEVARPDNDAVGPDTAEVNEIAAAWEASWGCVRIEWCSRAL
jgi:hypothetical protein